MSLVVVFEVRGDLAHFRRPDTLGTHASYPIPTRTALRGLIAAVLGEDRWPDGGRVGLRLLAPLQLFSQTITSTNKTIRPPTSYILPMKFRSLKPMTIPSRRKWWNP